MRYEFYLVQLVGIPEYFITYILMQLNIDTIGIMDIMDTLMGLLMV